MKQQRFFTFYESCLIAVSFMVLGALMIAAAPVGGKAAKAAACAGSLKKLMAATAVYANDNDGFFFPLAFDGRSGQCSKSVHSWPKGALTAKGYMPLKELATACPERPETGFQYGKPNYLRYHYGYSVCTAQPDGRQGNTAANQIKGRRTGDVRNPAETIIFADMTVMNENWPWLVTWDGRFWQENSAMTKNAPHGKNGVNIAFADGSAGFMEFSKISAPGKFNKYYFKFNKNGLVKP